MGKQANCSKHISPSLFSSLFLSLQIYFFQASLQVRPGHTGISPSQAWPHRHLSNQAWPHRHPSKSGLATQASLQVRPGHTGIPPSQAWPHRHPSKSGLATQAYLQVRPGHTGIPPSQAWPHRHLSRSCFSPNPHCANKHLRREGNILVRFHVCIHITQSQCQQETTWNAFPGSPRNFPSTHQLRERQCDELELGLIKSVGLYKCSITNYCIYSVLLYSFV